MTTANNDVLETVPSVETDDALKQAIAAATKRAAEVYAKGRNTLVDQIPIEEWLQWDASDDMAIVADSSGLGEDDDGRLEAAA